MNKNMNTKQQTEKSATHWGTCQICGKHYKADVKTNRLARHGYIRKGIQMGECRGSHELPLEKSCELVKERLAQIQHEIKRLQKVGDFFARTEIRALEVTEKRLIKKIANWKETDQVKI